MNELIEKASALEAVECLIEAAESAQDPTGRKALEMARDAIMDLPAVKDVEQKVYARWEYFHEHNWNKKATIDGYYRCPKCLHMFMRIEGAWWMKRCPECGTIMYWTDRGDGAKKDED